MNRPHVLRRAVSVIGERLKVGIGQSERSLLLGTILLATAISAVLGFLLVHYYSVDVLTILLFQPDDCQAVSGVQVGQHCFSDYALPEIVTMRPNPWAPYPLPMGSKPFMNNYTAAGMMPQMIFGYLGDSLGAPQLGLLAYELVLAIAVLTPAIWAARGALGMERLMVFLACGVAAIPAWMAIDRGNSVAFMAPIGLVFLVALCRQRWGLVAVMAVLAALVKPQFVVICVALFAFRQWRWGSIAVAAGTVLNLAAYALWPQDFPRTIVQSIRNTVGYGSFGDRVSDANVSFAKGLLTVPDGIRAGGARATVPEGFLDGPRSFIGYVVLVLIVVLLVVLGRRIPPVMVGIVLLATASLFPAVSNRYYLVFVLPVAALVVRDPDGPAGTGIFDRMGFVGGRRRAVGICLVLAAALCIAQIPLPNPHVHGVVGPMGVEARNILVTNTVFLAPLLWLVACMAIIGSYMRRPFPSCPGEEGSAVDTSVSTQSTPALMPDLTSQQPATL